ncbi:hypothetical protein [Spiroplasma endosymbiont of Megaselia nigra]|uniref:hypothetical protein n=1 Tax=Spiroplasma endosymbiont of Megaselia nigra TaxID=2478537 RepID=UPI000F872757|nr:hypothetical protein [Spiroplasma endosymbiont of Megaselia nigra]RUO85840.1 hypothetical protein D9R21_06475 [Spiroplasma endosymbiont of Megaselia nigra]
MLSNYTYSKYAINKGYNDDIKLFAPYYFELISSPNQKENRYWEFEHCKVQLISSYFNFSGWIGSPPEPINYWKEVKESDKLFIIDSKYYIVVARNSLNSDWKIFKLKNNGEKGSGLKTDWGERPVGWVFTSNGIYLATGNLLDSSMEYVWGKTKKYENYIKSVYRWDTIDEPQIPEIEPETGSIIKWNLKNQNNINNNDDEIKVTVKNNEISENYIYQLEANYFNWLSITNELETNNISSLIPAEIKLSDGEYGKYLTNLIVSNDRIEEYLNYFYQWYRLLYSKAVWTSMTKKIVEDNIKIVFDSHQKLFNLNQIEISGIWGYGNYDITIFTEKEQININNLKLFNKNNEKLSLITLEI